MHRANCDQKSENSKFKKALAIFVMFYMAI